MNLESGFRLGEWRVRPMRNLATGPRGEVHLSPRSMEVLICLARNGGEVVSREQFAREIWESTVVTDHALTRCISELRRTLDDPTAEAPLIETVPKRGYRLGVPVEPDTEAPAGAVTRRAGLWLGSLAGLLAVAGGLAWLSKPEAPAPNPGEPARVAVLPFETVGRAPTVPLAEGMHHDLLTRLSGIRELRVISSTSVNRYRNTDLAIPEISRELDVDWVVEGSVQQEGDRVQVNAQLIEAVSDTHRWARTYRRRLTAENLFEIQGEIIDDIGRSLALHLQPSSGSRAERLPTRSLEAYTLYTRAHIHLARRSPADMSRALELYEQALAVDPDYAEAWAELGEAHVMLVYYGHHAAADRIPLAREAVHRALQLNSENRRAHMVLGIIQLLHDRDGPEALVSLREGWRGIPDIARAWLGWGEAVLGDLATGIAFTREVVKDNPFSSGGLWSLATLLICAGDPVEALDLARTARAGSPAYGRAHLAEGQALLALDRPAEAGAAIRRGLEHAGPGERPEHRAWLAVSEAAAGREPAARAILDSLEDYGFGRGLVHLALDEPEAALSALASARFNDVDTLHIRYNPVFDPLRGNERWSELMARLNQSWGLDAKGREHPQSRG